ncbi:hypothetical protein DIPPA_34714 [Diplonema papillatum]|nr:hypothetical protein DIPPA_34714 [Diplonema papillatum]
MGCECSKPDEVPKAKAGKKLQPPLVTVEGVRIDDDDQPSKKKYTPWVKGKKNGSAGSRGGLLPAGDAGAALTANDDAYSCVDGISCATTTLLSDVDTEFPEEVFIDPTEPCTCISHPITTPIPHSEQVFTPVSCVTEDCKTRPVGGICLLHFPSRRQMKFLKQKGCNYVVTLQKDEENAQTVRSYCQLLHIKWIQVDFWHYFHQKNAEELIRYVRQVAALMRSGKFVMIHCAAGIHRTGMFAYAVLRCLGYDPASAVQSLRALRTATYLKVGAHRIQEIEQLLSEHFPFPLPPPYTLPDEILPPPAAKKEKANAADPGKSEPREAEQAAKGAAAGAPEPCTGDKPDGAGQAEAAVHPSCCGKKPETEEGNPDRAKDETKAAEQPSCCGKKPETEEGNPDGAKDETKAAEQPSRGGETPERSEPEAAEADPKAGEAEGESQAPPLASCCKNKGCA